MRKFLKFLLCLSLGIILMFFLGNILALIFTLVLYGIWVKDPALNTYKTDFSPYIVRTYTDYSDPQYLSDRSQYQIGYRDSPPVAPTYIQDD